MAKVLLIEPAGNLTRRKTGDKGFLQYTYCHLGLLSIATVLKRTGHDVDYFPINLERRHWQVKLKSLLLSKRYESVGISNTAYTIEQDMDVAFFIRQLLPSAIIVTGGYYSWFSPEKILKNTEIDIVVRGHGEIPFDQILSLKPTRLFSKRITEGLKKIPGVCFKYQERSHERIFLNKPFLMDQAKIEKLPPLSLDFYDFPKLWCDYPFINKWLPLYTSKGCPFSCHFCSVPFFEQRIMKFLPLNIIAHNLISASVTGARTVFFVDPDFDVNSKRSVELCNLIIRLKKEGRINKEIKFAAQVRIDLLNKSLIQKMSLANFSQLFIGIENVVPRILKDDLNKGHSLNKTRILNKLILIKRYKIRPFVYLILGPPKITAPEILENLKFAKLLRKRRMRMEINAFVTPFPETEYFSLYKKSGLIKYRKVVFKRFAQNRVAISEDKIPFILLPADKSACKLLNDLNDRACRSQNKNYSYALLQEAKNLLPAPT